MRSVVWCASSDIADIKHIRINVRELLNPVRVYSKVVIGGRGTSRRVGPVGQAVRNLKHGEFCRGISSRLTLKVTT